MLPIIKTRIPGPKSKACVKELHRVECPHITYADKDFPVFWAGAKGCSVTDVDGNRYLDMSSAFAVSNLGHSPDAIQAAMRRQIKNSWHAMGDVHPHVLKVECAKRIAALLPKNLSQMIFSSAGFEAVESALKTAYMATRKPGVLAFDGAYHGLGYGALQVTHRHFFREPFLNQTGEFGFFERFVAENTLSAREVDGVLARIRARIRSKSGKEIGAVLIEPIQGRGGIRVADYRFLRGLRKITRDEKIPLIFDEIFCGFGRTGKWFSFQHSGVIPDIVCLGKGMSTGFPISACVSSPQIMKAWGPTTGEAKHTSTFLGSPLGCAMVIATIDEMQKRRLIERAERTGKFIEKRLREIQRDFPRLVRDVRGRGLMRGIEFVKPKMAGSIVKKILKQGVIMLTSGEHSQVLGFTPPLVIEERELEYVFRAVRKLLTEFSSVAGA